MAKTTKKAAKPAKKKVGAKKKAAAPGRAAHSAVLKTLVGWTNQHQKSPVCYNRLSDGSWEVCFLQSDGSYGQCHEYNGPDNPRPICG